MEEVLRIYLSGSGRKLLTCLSEHEVQKFGIRSEVFEIGVSFFEFGVMFLDSE